MATAEQTTECPRALVVIPGHLNYFYNLCGRRVAETLTELGFSVDVGTLATLADRQQSYAWCFLANISEILLSCSDAAARLQSLRRRCRTMVAGALDCVGTSWYGALHDHCLAHEIDALIDLGLHDQRPSLPADKQFLYRFVVNGLTADELRSLQDPIEEDRAIPWAFIGHCTAERAALVDTLIRTVDPRGFVYMPVLAPYTEKASPHLNQRQFEAVLRKTRCQVWCSHHSHFYMEPERFRTSFLTGSLPVKVVSSPSADSIPQSAPFRYLVMAENALPCLRDRSVWEGLQQRFRSDFRSIPPLADGLAQFLRSTGVLHSDSPAPAARPSVVRASVAA